MSFIEQQLATTTFVAFLGDAKPPTASMKKLIKSPFFDLFAPNLTWGRGCVNKGSGGSNHVIGRGCSH